jgi:hypothetical protein
MDELTDKIEDDHFLTPEELKEMRAIIQHSFEQAKQKGKSPSEIKDELHPPKEKSSPDDSASPD